MTERKRQLRTADYPQDARERLGQAVAKAREAAGWRFRTDFIEAAKLIGEKISIRSLGAVESGEAGAGQSVLFAIGRMLPGWSEDTPRQILEGGPAPVADIVAAENRELGPREEVLTATTQELAKLARMYAWYKARGRGDDPREEDEERFMLWALELRQRERHIEPNSPGNRDVS